MTNIAEASAAAYRVARDVRGIPITIQRLDGQAPAITTKTATVLAVIPSTLLTEGDPVGETVAIDSRVFIVLTADLVAGGFPVPVRKNDRIVVPGSSYKMNVTNVDAEKRAIAAAVEITASGAT